MTSIIISKRERNESNNTRKVSYESLPEPILQQILSIIGSKSIADLHSVKMCSKFFSKLAYDKDVLKKVSFENCPEIQWEPNENALAFLKLCEASGNPEVLFSEGLREFINYPVGNIGGLEKVKAAVEDGHILAKYVYGLIMLCSENDESRKEGIKHLRYLRMAKCILYCRQKIQQIEQYFWRYNGMLVCNKTPVCKSMPSCGGWGLKKGRWGFFDDDISLCENCRWDHELKFFYGIFRVPYI